VSVDEVPVDELGRSTSWAGRRAVGQQVGLFSKVDKVSVDKMSVDELSVD
jgi:hypothetical protein